MKKRDLYISRYRGRGEVDYSGFTLKNYREEVFLDQTGRLPAEGGNYLVPPPSHTAENARVYLSPAERLSDKSSTTRLNDAPNNPPESMENKEQLPSKEPSDDTAGTEQSAAPEKSRGEDKGDGADSKLPALSNRESLTPSPFYFGQATAGRAARATKTKRRTAVAVCLFLSFFFAYNLLLNYMSGGAALAFINIEGYTAVYYAVCVGEYGDYETAKAEAEAVMARGGAGYAVRDKNYKLIADVFLSSADAEANRAEIPGAFIYKINIRKAGLSKYTETQKSRFSAFLGIDGKLYNELFFIARTVSAGTLDIPSARNRVKSLISEVDNIAEIIKPISGDPAVFKKIEENLTAVTSALRYLLTEKSLTPSFAANTRYTYAMILSMYRALLSEF